MCLIRHICAGILCCCGVSHLHVAWVSGTGIASWELQAGSLATAALHGRYPTEHLDARDNQVLRLGLSHLNSAVPPWRPLTSSKCESSI